MWFLVLFTKIPSSDTFEGEEWRTLVIEIRLGEQMSHSGEKKKTNILGRILNVPFKILETMNTLRCNAKLWIKIMQNRARHIKMVNNSKSPSLGWLITKHYLAFLSGYKYLVLMSGYLLYTTNSFITFVRRWETPKNSIQLNQVNEHTHTYIYMCLCVYIHIKLVDEPLSDEN